MKQIKAGGPPQEPTPNWWAAKLAICSNCKGEFELESGDLPTRMEVEKTPNGKREAWFKCPTKTLNVEGTGSHIIDASKPSWVCGGQLHVRVN